jgi:hypothetical protein
MSWVAATRMSGAAPSSTVLSASPCKAIAAIQEIHLGMAMKKPFVPRPDAVQSRRTVAYEIVHSQSSPDHGRQTRRRFCARRKIGSILVALESSFSKMAKRGRHASSTGEPPVAMGRRRHDSSPVGLARRLNTPRHSLPLFPQNK